MALITCTMWCNHRHRLLPEYFHRPKQKLIMIKQLLPIAPPPGPWQLLSTFCLYEKRSNSHRGIPDIYPSVSGLFHLA